VVSLFEILLNYQTQRMRLFPICEREVISHNCSTYER